MCGLNNNTLTALTTLTAPTTPTAVPALPNCLRRRGTTGALPTLANLMYVPPRESVDLTLHFTPPKPEGKAERGEQREDYTVQGCLMVTYTNDDVQVRALGVWEREARTPRWSVCEGAGCVGEGGTNTNDGVCVRALGMSGREAQTPMMECV